MCERNRAKTGSFGGNRLTFYLGMTAHQSTLDALEPATQGVAHVLHPRQELLAHDLHLLRAIGGDIPHLAGIGAQVVQLLDRKRREHVLPVR